MMAQRILPIAICALSACSISFRTLTPIYPLVTYSDRTPVIDSLQPTFQWHPVSEADTTYDLVIYEQLQGRYVHGGIYYRTADLKGRLVYYREGLKGSEHKAEEPLKPNSRYYWSLRARQNDRVTSWATYGFSDGGSSGSGQLFGFETPP